MSRELEEIISESGIKNEIFDQSLESDQNTDLAPVKNKEHENLYDFDVTIKKEESFEPCHESINDPDETNSNSTYEYDIPSDSCDRNEDVTHSNDEDSLYDDIFSTGIEFTPTQTKKTVERSKTINSRTKRKGKKKDLAPVKNEEHENLYDFDVTIKKEELFEPCHESLNEADETNSNSTYEYDIPSDSCDRNEDITHSNDEDSLYDGIFSTGIKFTPTQTKKTVIRCETIKRTETINSRTKRKGKKKADVKFSCRLCSKNFSSAKDFFLHSHHNGLRNSEEKLKIDKKINNYFVQTAQTQPNKKNRETKFKTVAHMREAVNTKTKSSKRKIHQCDQCQQVFTLYNNLLRHRKTHSDGRVISDYCQKDYNRKSYLAEHIKEVQTVEHMPEAVNTKTKSSKRKIHQCDQCQQVFTLYNNLLRHRKTHSDGRVISDYCQKDYNRKSYLAEHKKEVQTVAHMPEAVNTKTKSSKRKIHQCDQCQQVFTLYNNLLRHRKTHSDGRVICDYCQKDYNRKSYLVEHIKEVHLKIARNCTVFMCEICDKRLKSSYALRNHLQIHTGKKPFRCDVCKKEFSNKWNYSVHCKSKQHNRRISG